MSTNPAIAAAVAAAKAAAAQAAPAANTNLPSAPAAVGMPAPAPAQLPAGRRMGLDDLDNGGMSVDGYWKVKAEGLKVDDKPGLIETAVVTIKMNEVQVCQAVKYGNPAQYEKTYDGVRTAKGGDWAAACARAKQADPSNRSDPYVSADIPMTVYEDVKDSKSTLVAEKGKRLGYGLSTTNLANFRDFKKEVEAKGLMNETLIVVIGAQRRTNKAGNEWGVMTFTLVGAVPSAEADESGE